MKANSIATNRKKSKPKLIHFSGEYGVSKNWKLRWVQLGPNYWLCRGRPGGTDHFGCSGGCNYIPLSKERRVFLNFFCFEFKPLNFILQIRVMNWIYRFRGCGGSNQDAKTVDTEYDQNLNRTNQLFKKLFDLKRGLSKTEMFQVRRTR